MIFNEHHKELFQGFKRFYLDNIAELCKLQDEVVKKGTEQTPMNYWLQINQVDVNTELPLPFKLTHLQRKELFNFNWQKAIFLFDELERMGIEYDQIALVDSSFMIRWDAPNFLN